MIASVASKRRQQARQASQLETIAPAEAPETPSVYEAMSDATAAELGINDDDEDDDDEVGW
jgi:hypothetical protein